jgi:hypothetical protein
MVYPERASLWLWYSWVWTPTRQQESAEYGVRKSVESTGGV